MGARQGRQSRGAGEQGRESPSLSVLSSLPPRLPSRRAVAGTCRNEEKTAALVARGVVAWKWNMEEDYELDLEAAEALRRATHVLSTVPPAWGEDPVVQAHSQLLEDAPGLQWVGYISSTGVYGSHEGAWVDESAELRATNGKGLARILAEHNWISLGCESGLPVHVFRCGGIYGPRRRCGERVCACACSSNRAEGSLLSSSAFTCSPLAVAAVASDPTAEVPALPQRTGGRAAGRRAQRKPAAARAAAVHPALPRAGHLPGAGGQHAKTQPHRCV